MLNKVMLIGRLGQDPEVRYTQTGTAVCNFTLATGERFKDKFGNREEKTTWHKITVFGKLAEVCGQNLEKGKMVYCEGKIEQSEWTDKASGEYRKTLQIIVHQCTFLSKGGDRPSLPADREQDWSDRDRHEDTAWKEEPQPQEEEEADDIPF